MIYTIGQYDPASINGANKVGRRPTSDDPHYGGGIAFETIEDAYDYCEEHAPGYGVFCLECDWSNTYWDGEKSINRIVNDATIKVMK